MFRNVNHHANIKATKLTGCLASQRLMALYTLVSLHYSTENTRILSHAYFLKSSAVISPSRRRRRNFFIREQTLLFLRRIYVVFVVYPLQECIQSLSMKPMHVLPAVVQLRGDLLPWMIIDVTLVKHYLHWRRWKQFNTLDYLTQR